MAELRNTESKQAWSPTREDVIGRSRSCDWVLAQSDVSARHAVIRWTGKVWELHDLDSRNGTFVSGHRLGAGQRVTLLPNMRIHFGTRSADWVAVDTSPPRTVAIRLQDRRRVAERDGAIALTSAGSDGALLVQDDQGRWACERPGQPRCQLDDGATFDVNGDEWQLCMGTPADETRDASGCPTTLDLIRLRFCVSSDEEHVHLVAEVSGREVPIETRAHHYLLLTLARERIAHMRQHPNVKTSHGWIHQETVSRMLKKSATHLNVEIHRARQQFSRLGIGNGSGAQIVERRRGTGEIRLGCPNLEVERLQPLLATELR